MMTEKKVWGTVIELSDNGLSKTSILRIDKGGTCSWHYHEHRFNVFYVVSGLIIVRWSPTQTARERHELYLGPGADTIIAPGEVHEFAALEDSIVIEIDYASNQVDDIIRLRYGFVNTKLRDKRKKTIKLNRTKP